MTAVALQESIPNWRVADDRTAERLDEDLLVRAYRFSERAHLGQKRLSGEDYVSHCVEVAKILADLQLDSVTVASGLIHDVVEDTAVTVEEVEREFGREIASIVDGLTKIGTLPAQFSGDRSSDAPAGAGEEDAAALKLHGSMLLGPQSQELPRPLTSASRWARLRSKNPRLHRRGRGRGARATAG